jgi:hypothetical protein
MSQEERAADDALKAAKAEQLAQMSDEEALAVLIKARPYIPPEEVEAELKVRLIRVIKALTVGLSDFKIESALASDRLLSVTRWLTGLTVALVVLTVFLAMLTGVVVVLTGVVVWHDLRR